MPEPGEAIELPIVPVDVARAAESGPRRNGSQHAMHQLHVRPSPQRGPDPHIFQSFWMGGFESATHVNSLGQRLDMIAATQHDTQADEDFARLASVGLLTAREGARWHLIEQRPGHYDFSSLQAMLEAANRNGIQIIWNLCHYGWPDFMDLLEPRFVERFADFAYATARHILSHSQLLPVFVPINEISFFAWAMERPGLIHTTLPGRGDDLKRRLVRAAIAACDAIWSIEPRARMATVEPMVHVVPPRDRPDLTAAAAAQNESQFEAWDLLSGCLEPELGGHRRYLDLVGVNYYHSNQFEHPDVRLRWEDVPLDDRWAPLHQLLASVHVRYGRPMFMAETSHFGVGRAAWLGEIAAQVMLARHSGVPVHGVCLYPIIDRPDWDNPDHWHNSGLWDLQPQPDGTLTRRLCEPYAIALRAAQHLIPDH
jgi:hypothetical protein